ncbi:DUF123 domain-containing protein [Caldichromatium japonicum]|uniref:DUF123 domain-containing protein n=1 Tax=Caldichromatium japonicum TaxID=2699430 RepID=UPI001FE2F923|nr:DUF123 domain-containing protein [Caldichromatium japonicum]
MGTNRAVRRDQAHRRCLAICWECAGAWGLSARCRHHLRIAHRPHWHLDHLRPRCQPLGCWVSLGHESSEHRWARRLGELADAVYPLSRFGASDCSCPAHLIPFAPGARDGGPLCPSGGRAGLAGSCGLARSTMIGSCAKTRWVIPPER